MTIIAEVGVGVAADIAKGLLEHQAKRFTRTKVAKALSAAGLLKPDFQQRLRSILQAAIVEFFDNHPDYCVDGIVSFLSDRYVHREFSNYLLEGRPINLQKMSSLLADFLDVPKAGGPAAWPRGIDAAQLFRRFLAQVTSTLLADGEPAIALLGRTLSELAITVSEINNEIRSLRSDLPVLFDKVAADQQSTEWKTFERDYLLHIGSRYSRLTTPGARDLHGVKQSLSVAYISLSVRAHAKADVIPTEQFLRDNRRIVIRGPAGSGKTTLLSYIAWSCTQSDDEQWTGGIPFFIPLRTVARTDLGPPSADKLVAYSVDAETWAAAAPEGWVNDLLRRQRRAVIMIDGVDELPGPRRPEFWDWLARFGEEYPDIRIIVTSRSLPGSVSSDTPIRTDEWNIPSGFVEVHLEEMSDADVMRFLEHWHDSVDLTKLEKFEITELQRARSLLPKKLSDPGNRRIRELCSTPLLCAMVCVLHWREEGYLPSQRVELYDRCCEMLIEARDLKRQILLPPGPLAAMTKNDKERVLQRLAFEMMDNKPDSDEVQAQTYRIEISRSKAVKWIAPWIDGFQNAEARKCSAQHVLDHLIERTGLLREPSGGLVDFPHRTFQEYLAACAAGAAGKEEFLAKKADDDQWHETIMLAAGTTTGGIKFGHDLVEALVDRAQRHKSPRVRSQQVRKTCFALALGCLENLRQPDPEVRQKVLARLNELVPPTGEAGAKVLAVAGSAAVPHLSYAAWKDQETPVVAACAQALRLIGTDLAIRALESGYIDDRRPAVITEVCRSAKIDFDHIPMIAEHVNSESELPSYANWRDGRLISNLSGLRRLTIQTPIPLNLKSVEQLDKLETVFANEVSLDALAEVDWPKTTKEFSLVKCTGRNFSWLKRRAALQKLIIGMTDELYLQQIEGISSLEDLGIVQCTLFDAESLLRLPNLKTLSLINCEGFQKLPNLQQLRQLRYLRLSRLNLENLDEVSRCASLRFLELNSARGISSIKALSNNLQLRVLHLGDLPDIKGLAGIQDLPLRQLDLATMSHLEKISEVADLDELRELTLDECPKLGALPQLATEQLEKLVLRSLPEIVNFDSLVAPRISDLRVIECPKLTGFDNLKLSELKNVALSYLPVINSIKFLSRAEKLKSIALNGLSIDDLKPLSNLENLESLIISECQSITDISPLSELSGLTDIVISDCYGITDLSPLTKLPRLRSLTLASEGPLREGYPVSVPESLQAIARRQSYYRFSASEPRRWRHYFARFPEYYQLRSLAGRRWISNAFDFESLALIG